MICFACTLIVTVCAAISRSGQPQTPPTVTKPEDLCTVAGKVLNESTGEPVKDAMVVIAQFKGNAPSGGYTVMSDAEGHYEAAKVQPGTYRVMASRAGFMLADYGLSAPRLGQPNATPAGRPLNIASGQKISDIDFKLRPFGVIAGRVIASGGAPIPGVRVYAMRRGYSSGGIQLTSAATTITNDLGDYRILQIPPGRYYVGAMYEASAAELAGTDRSAKPRQEGYAPMYFPGVFDPSAASLVDAPAGRVTEGINLKLAKTSLTRITGRVLNQTGYPGPVMLRLRAPKAPELPERATEADPQGRFELRGIATGNYLLMADVRPSGGTYPIVSMPLQVGKEPIDNVDMTLTAGIDIAGQVKAEGDESVDLRGSRVGLVTVIYSNSTGASVAALSPLGDGGSFVMRPVFPGHYDVVIDQAPQGYYLKSARLGDRDVTEGIDVTTAAVAPLQVVLGRGSPEVHGQVMDENGAPAPGVTVVLVP